MPCLLGHIIWYINYLGTLLNLAHVLESHFLQISTMCILIVIIAPKLGWIDRSQAFRATREKPSWFSVEHVLPSTDCPDSEGFKGLQSSDSVIERYTETCRLRQRKHYWTGCWDLYPDPSRGQIRSLALACKRKAAHFRKRLYFYISTSSVCLGVLRPLAGIDFDFAADDNKPTLKPSCWCEKEDLLSVQMYWAIRNWHWPRSCQTVRSVRNASCCCTAPFCDDHRWLRRAPGTSFSSTTTFESFIIDPESNLVAISGLSLPWLAATGWTRACHREFRLRHTYKRRWLSSRQPNLRLTSTTSRSVNQITSNANLLQ